jgi:hypothetical protein
MLQFRGNEDSMSELTLPKSADELVEQLRCLHEQRKRRPPTRRRLPLTREQRVSILEKTAGRCHLCGGEVQQERFAADHVLAHAAGGKHELNNYLPAHHLCNGCRWFYSPEEVQWILRMGIWTRKQIEDGTSIGKKMLAEFFQHEKAVEKRRVGRRARATVRANV